MAHNYLSVGSTPTPKGRIRVAFLLVELSQLALKGLIGQSYSESMPLFGGGGGGLSPL